MSKSIILSAKDFSITYEPTHHTSSTIRDIFVSIIKNPFGFLFKSNDRFLVLDRISFDINQGDFVGLIGINGSGKTSLCRYLSGIIKCKEITSYGDIRAIFDTNIAFYPNLTGKENAIMLVELLYAKYTAIERKEIVAESLLFSELNEFIDVPVYSYSKGMRARLYLSLISAREADLIILDETFGGTDTFFAEKISQRINNLIAKSGAAIIVSHNIDDLKKYCNRAIVLKDKKIFHDGPLEAGIEKYLNSY